MCMYVYIYICMPIYVYMYMFRPSLKNEQRFQTWVSGMMVPSN